jgi:hypothetical protein
VDHYRLLEAGELRCQRIEFVGPDARVLNMVGTISVPSLWLMKKGAAKRGRTARDRHMTAECWLRDLHLGAVDEAFGRHRPQVFLARN